MYAFISDDALQRRITEARIVPDVGGDLGIVETTNQHTTTHRELGAVALNFAALQLLNMTQGVQKKERQRYF